MTSPVLATGFIIWRKLGLQFEYLLLQTSYGLFHWTPPKGHVDPGETPLDAAIRETREEAGLEHGVDYSKTEGFQCDLLYDAGGKPKKVTYWLGELIKKDAAVTLSHEHTNFKWLQLKEACDLSKFEDMQKALRDAEEFLKNR